MCNFNCIYCECGWTPGKQELKQTFHPRHIVKQQLEEQLSEMKKNKKALDVITFAGNGEPTMHPEFPGIIDDTHEIRKRYFQDAKIAVLSNASLIYKPNIAAALNKVDKNILKLDSAFDETIQLLNNPRTKLTVEKLTKRLKIFNGNFILQTMFVQGTYNDHKIDNTTDKEINAWLELVNELKPKEVMIYTIERDTPTAGLEKVSPEKLQEISNKVIQLGITTQVSV